MEYPWETIIKLYRKGRGLRSEKTIADWASDFSKYIRSFGKITKANREKNTKEVARALMASVLDEADDIAIRRGIVMASEDYKDILKSIFSDKLADVIETERWLDDGEATAFVKAHGALVDGVRDEFVADFGDKELTDFADAYISAAILLKSPSPISSGIVIAGFGDDEYFPSFVSLECDGYLGNRVKLYQESALEVSRQMTGGMRAFAQGEMVQRFMTGLDPTLGTTLMTAFGEVLSDNCLKVLETYGSKANKKDSVRDAVRKASHDSMDALLEQVHSYTARAYSSPIVEMISLLPKDELANLAESLVALTSLKRRVSSDVETVGGAIDVALISKGDGFVWIKRKYYFPEELNPQFNRNYMNDIHQGDTA